MARIVIAEDQGHIRHLLGMWMSRNGHEVHEAPNGRIALRILEQQPADLLITDVNMPEVDGLAVARQAFDLCPTLRRIFIMTARCDQQDILSAVTDPRVRIFPKPFSPSQVLQEVEQTLKNTAVTGAGEGI